MNKFRKILIIDDVELDRTILRRVLEKNAYSVIEATDGVKGIAKAVDEKPDCIIMDIVMPSLSGFEATRLLNDIPETKDIPIIICSAKGLVADQKWGIRQGAKEYIIKPIKAADVLAKLKSVESSK